MSVDLRPVNDPIEIAAYHSRMVECAINSREPAKAHAVVDRAFDMLAEVASEQVTHDDDICLVVGQRIIDTLNSQGITTIGDLCNHSRDSLTSIHQIRYKSVDLIERNLAKHGMALSRA